MGEPSTHRTGPSLLERLRRLDTPTVCNVIELFDVRPRTQGYADARVRACFPDLPPMVGFAATATFRASATPRPEEARSSVEEQVERFAELSGPAVVVFQDLDDPAVGATFGEVMCATYKAFGAAGLVTSGTGRDLDAVRALEFPVFASGTTCSHGYNRVLDVHVPVRVGGLEIRPDDLLHGDRNGVTTIPREIAAEVADTADEYVAAERIVLDALRARAPTLGLLREAQAEAASRVAALRARVTRAR